MAINATTVWRIRAGGSAANGGGYDPGIAGAATDYTDQDAAQASWVNLATTGVTATVTSASATFTSAMVGNCIRISAGTNFTAGYYFIVTFTNSTTVVLDRAPTTGVGASGVGSLGGAFASLSQVVNGGTNTQPTITTPLAAGHTVMIRGAGSSNPTSIDYTWTGGYWQLPSGDTTSGMITISGYNGKPLISCDAFFVWVATGTRWSSIKFKLANATSAGSGGIIFDTTGLGFSINNCIFDQNGVDTEGVGSSCSVTNSWFMNSGSTSAGSSYAIRVNVGYGKLYTGNVIDGWRGGGIRNLGAFCAVIVNNIIANVKGNPGVSLETSDTSFRDTVYGNTIYNGAAAGISLTTAQAIAGAKIFNNIIANNATYGIDCTVGSTALNERTFMLHPNYNDLFSNTTSAYHNMSAGANDVTLDPQFVNAGSGNFAIGTNLKALGFPGAFQSATTTGYLDIGSVQRQEAGGLTAIGDAG